MREVDIFRADGTDVEPTTIRIHHEAPPLPYDGAYARFTAEGAALAEAIWTSCPGGTVDALIAALLARRASLLRVTFPGEQP